MRSDCTHVGVKNSFILQTAYCLFVKSLHFISVLGLLELRTKFLNIITFKSRNNAVTFLCSCSKEVVRRVQSEESSILKLGTELRGNFGVIQKFYFKLCRLINIELFFFKESRILQNQQTGYNETLLSICETPSSSFAYKLCGVTSIAVHPLRQKL
jgi:hypothetical protein